MTKQVGRKSALALAVVALLIAVVNVAARDNMSPDAWLQKMSNAILTLDYEGTVIRQGKDGAQPLKVVHKTIDGIVNERIVTQEGNGLELIRVGDEVHCILPDKKSVLVEQWKNASSLFATLPSSKVDPGAQYDILIVGNGEERVAGRKAVKIAIKPKDSHRFEHRYWLDRATGFPLRTELIDQQGDVVNQLKFADVQIDSPISKHKLEPSVSLDNFTWYANPGKNSADSDVTQQSDWTSDGLPHGFKAVSAGSEVLTASKTPVTHILYSDGLASVSVFISEQIDDALQTAARRGASNSYSTQWNGFQITAVGEVPPSTVESIATGMRLR